MAAFITACIVVAPVHSCIFDFWQMFFVPVSDVAIFCNRVEIAIRVFSRARDFADTRPIPVIDGARVPVVPMRPRIALTMAMVRMTGVIVSMVVIVTMVVSAMVAAIAAMVVST